MAIKRGKGLLYPERQRCLRCRQFFAFTVIGGLYDSYTCAGHPEPSTNPDDWPRQHFTFRGGERVEKRHYACEFDAKRAQKYLPTKDIYQCDYCLYWHLGTLRAPEGVIPG